MNACVDAYLSIQSPYSYFAAPRLRRLDGHPEVEVRLRTVMPAVLRVPGSYADRGPMEQAYFLLDVARTAAFLGLDYAEPEPHPVAFEPGSLYRAAAEQPRIHQLLDLLMAGAETGDGLALFEALAHLIWSGHTPGWDRGDHVRRAVAAAGFEPNHLERHVEAHRERLREELLANNEALLAAGHWGVPCFVVDDEPFYGQDRFDQLIWRLGITPSEIEC